MSMLSMAMHFRSRTLHRTTSSILTAMTRWRAYSPTSTTDEGDEGAPPPSQSHFSKYKHFTPNDAASFDDEFGRLASSQNWAPGSQQYTKQRTITMREELELHFFSPPEQLGDFNDEEEQEQELTAEEIRLRGYQALCQEVGIDPSDLVAVCKKQLKNTLVNIVDLIDTRRTGKPVKIWGSFEEFRAYTMLSEHRINLQEAKRPPGYVASLLQRLSPARSRPKQGALKRGRSNRVTKRKA
ncbi:hypothetical protein F5144DRAFT_592115 [Chaetomium tenue]|uniref:Uncharacterized protein n=1 Tax=Chaetomium tenue TaxID=1854479 RepID=A0ACB7PDM7_9PEZI|nr:hypothetical protein F5144DRAFT_592115 [Chaetomium globosum]